MDCLKKPVGFMLGMFFSYQAVAGLDPIGQSVSPAQLPSTVNIGDSLSVTYTLTNNKSVPVKVSITSTSVGNGIVVYDRCNGKTLAKNGAVGSQCSINLSLEPTTAGPLSWQGVMHYDNNVVPLSKLSTTVTGVSGSVTGKAVVELNPETVVNQTYPFEFSFTNNGTVPVTGSGVVTSNVTTYQILLNNCTNKTLTVGAPGNTCTITGSFSPTATGAVSIKASFPYTPGSLTATSTTSTVVSAAPVDEISGQIINQLPPNANANTDYPVWFQFTNTGNAPVSFTPIVSLPSVTGITNTCTSNNPLPVQATCDIKGTFNTAQTNTSYTLSAQLSPASNPLSTSTLTAPTSTFYVGIYPVSLRVSAGANNRPYQFHYYLVSQSLSAIPLNINFQNPDSIQLAASTIDYAQVPAVTYTSHYQCTGGVDTPFNPATQLPLAISLPGTGGTCDIWVAFNASTSTNTTDEFLLDYTSTVSPMPPSVVTPITYATGNALQVNGSPVVRTIKFTNSCSYPVAYALYRSAVISKNPSASTTPQQCANNTDCFGGSECVMVSNSLKQCEWILPSAPGNHYRLGANGDSVTISIPIYDNALQNGGVRNLAWGGNLAGRLGCYDTEADAPVLHPNQTVFPSCLVNDCGPDPDNNAIIGKCSQGIGGTFNSPTSATEFTFVSDDPLVNSNDVSASPATNGNLGVDTYNLTVINGITVPYSMTPVNATYDPSKPYVCGGPGLNHVQPGSHLGSCSWTFTGNATQYRWVEIGTPSSCTTDADCTSPNICGLMATPTGATPTITQSCGTPIETYLNTTTPLYWTSDQLCSLNNAFNTAPFSCSTSLPSAFNPNTYFNMYQCVPAAGSAAGVLGSCYSTGASAECCGCVDWWNQGITVPMYPATSQCENTSDSTWTTNVLPQLQWMKEGCPTSYTYPYDDGSSTFTCLVNEPLNTPAAPFNGNVNTTNYEVVFCPQ